MADPRFHHLRLDENRGLGAALNCGLNAARGSTAAARAGCGRATESCTRWFPAGPARGIYI
ncbi:MAG: glycosyltransferase [Bryobacterales bacterium]|nr:glycosyltransferase [Bryobacterales bacterium]